MTKKVKAILLDTRSIQKYIFASNKLRTNVGASHLVETIFEEVMAEVLEKTGLKMHVTDKEKKEKIEAEHSLRMEVDDDVECEVAYTGGGNMIILVSEALSDSEQVCRNIVGAWSRKLLVATPGLKTGAAIGDLSLGEDFQTSLNELYAKLKDNQNRVFPNVDLPYTGLTVECKLSGKGADTYYYNPDVFKEEKAAYVASSEKAKVEAYEPANKRLLEKVGELCPRIASYKFADSLEDLGQKKGNEYIAVIHVDGNDMGKKFSNCKDMKERKDLSQKVAECTNAAFARLVDDVIDEYDCYADDTFADGTYVAGELLDPKITQKKILPLRPIIIGGDDITFVCPAQTALVYVRRFMEHLKEYKLLVRDEAGEKITVPFHSCAGIAIVPTKYPFFRAYELAEELCGKAKSKARQVAGGASFLDYIILHGEQGTDLDLIRQEEYQGALGNMHYGPYLVDAITAPKSVERLIRGALELQKMPKNKVKEMRDIIAKGEGEIHLYMEQLRHTGTAEQIPVVEHKLDQFREELWGVEKGEKVTPYLDMIEVMEFIYDERKCQG